MLRILLLLLCACVPVMGQSTQKADTPKWAYAMWGGLAATAHVQAARDVNSTFRLREVCPSCTERNPFVRGLYNSGNKKGMHATAQGATAGANLLSLWMLKQNKWPALKGIFWVPQAVVIVGSGIATSRNNAEYHRRTQFQFTVRF